MITLNQIVKRFEEFATNHYFVQTFSSGSPNDIDLDKFSEYPLMHVVYVGASLSTGTKAMSFEVYVLDATSATESNTRMEREVVSDSEQCLQDLIADLVTGLNIFEEEYVFDSGVITPLESVDKAVLCGAMLDVTISVPYDASSCYAPIDGVDYANDTVTYQRRGVLMIKEADGSPEVPSVRTIIVPNDSLTDNGNGTVTLNFASGLAESNKHFEYLQTGSFIQVHGLIPDGIGYTRMLYILGNATVTGNAPVGVVQDSQGRFVSFTGMSSGMPLTLKCRFELYQDDAYPTTDDVIVFNFVINKSGNTRFPTSDTTLTENIVDIPLGQPFAQEYTVIIDTAVYVQPDWEIESRLYSLYGTVYVKLKEISYEVYSNSL